MKTTNDSSGFISGVKWPAPSIVAYRSPLYPTVYPATCNWGVKAQKHPFIMHTCDKQLI